MKAIIHILAAITAGLIEVSTVNAQQPLNRETRLLIIDGNKLYKQERYAEAEEKYRKALQLMPESDFAQYNLAATLLKQDSDPSNTELRDQAFSILSKLSEGAADSSIAELSAYNSGNILFNSQKYAESIEMYKRALRINPDNDLARENLRLAQLMLDNQQNDDKNQDKNQDQDNKDQNQNQDKQDQNQDQQNQNQDQQQQNQDQQQQQQQPQQPQNQGSITDENAEAILKTMQNKENETRKRIEERKKKDAPRRPITNPW